MSWYEYRGMAEEKGARLPYASELREAGVSVEFDQWLPVAFDENDETTGRNDGFVGNGRVNVWSNIGPRRYVTEVPSWGLDSLPYEWKRLPWFYVSEGGDDESDDDECTDKDGAMFWAMIDGYASAMPAVLAQCAVFVEDPEKFNVEENREPTCECIETLYEKGVVPNDYQKTPKCYITTDEGDKVWTEDYLEHMLGACRGGEESDCVDDPKGIVAADPTKDCENIQPYGAWSCDYRDYDFNGHDVFIWELCPKTCGRCADLPIKDEDLCGEDHLVAFWAMIGGYASFMPDVLAQCAEFVEHYEEFDVEENEEPSCACIETLFEEDVLPNDYEKTPKCYTLTEEGDKMWTEDYLEYMLHHCRDDEDEDECVEEDKVIFFGMVGGYARFMRDVREHCSEMIQDPEKFDFENNEGPSCRCLATLYEEEIVPNDYQKTPKCYIWNEEGDRVWAEEYLGQLMESCEDDHEHTEHDPSKCSENGNHDNDCCGVPADTTCTGGYVKVMTSELCCPESICPWRPYKYECHEPTVERFEGELCDERVGMEFDRRVQSRGSKKVQAACAGGEQALEDCHCRMELHEPENLLFLEATLPKCYLHIGAEYVLLKDWLYHGLLECLEQGVVDPSEGALPAPGDSLSKEQTQDLLKTVRKELEILEDGLLPKASKNLKEMKKEINASKKSLKKLSKKVSKKML